MGLINAQAYRNGYKDGKYPAPSGDTEDKMTPAFMLDMCQYIWSLYVSDYGVVPYDDNGFWELRAYARGKQDRQKYMDILDPSQKSGKGNSEEGFININWDVVQILPHILDVARGKLMDVEYDIHLQANDGTANDERDKAYRRQMLEMLPEWQALKQATGQEMDDKPDLQGLETAEDVKAFFEMGGFQLAYEILGQDALQATKYESKWEQIKDKLLNDLLTVGMACSKTVAEEKTGLVKEEYKDVERLVARNSIYEDYRDIDFAGSWARETISTIRMNSDLSEEELIHIAKLYAKVGGNASGSGARAHLLNGDQRDEYYQRHGRYPIDDYKIQVLDICFTAADAERYVYGNHRDGNFVYDQVGLESELNKRDRKKGKEIHSQTVQWVYNCKWIVGTNYVYSFGKENAVVRKGVAGNKRAVLPYHIYKRDSSAMVERAIPFVDDIQLATLKIRNLMAKLPPAPSMMMDISALQESINLGGQKYGITELIEIFGRTGVLIYKSVNEWGTPGAANKTPIMPAPVEVQQRFNMLLNVIDVNMNQLRLLLGINEVADGSSPQAGMLKGVMEGLQQATNNALKPYVRGYESIFTNASEYQLLKWQAVLTAKDNVKAMYQPFNSMALKAVKITKELSRYEFGVMVSRRPTEQEKQMMLQHITQLRDTRNASGQGGISEADYFKIANMIRGGDIKKAELQLVIASRRQAQLDQQRSQANMEQQKQVQIETAQAASQAEMQKNQAEMQGKMQLEQMKHQFKMEQMELEKNNQIEIIAAKTQADTTRDSINNAQKNDVEKDVGAPPVGQGQTNLQRGQLIR